MDKIFQTLSGYKTYIIAGATVLYCVLGILLHFMTVPMAIAFIGSAGSIAALRNGVAKAQGILEVVLEILKLLGQPAQPAPVAPVTPVAPIVPPAAPIV